MDRPITGKFVLFEDNEDGTSRMTFCLGELTDNQEIVVIVPIRLEDMQDFVPKEISGDAAREFLHNNAVVVPNDLEDIE